MVKLEGGKRVAFNTTISYGRSLIAICFVLFSSRWALGFLGAVDYGLYNLIGSVLAVVVFLNTILANGDARFFAIGIGRNSQTELNKVFNTALSLHIIIPLIVALAGVIAGEYVLEHYLVIPQNRIKIVVVAYRITMIASFVTMVTVPFSTLFVAYQNILDLSLISLLQTFLMFISAYLIRFSFGGCDKLLLYTTLIATSQILICIIKVIVSSRKYKCSKINYYYFFDKLISASIIKYSFWNMLGDLGHLIRTQGVSVIVNLFFGPSGNAALGIANQVSMQASNLTNSMSTSISPEIYRKVGEGHLNSAKSLSEISSRVGVVLMLLLGVPILLNLDCLLKQWLINVPDGTNILCVCLIMMYIIEKLTIGQHIMLKALNKVALVNILVFISFCMSVVFPLCGLNKLGLMGIGISLVLSMILSRCAILYCGKMFETYDMPVYLRSTLLPVTMILIVLLGLGYFHFQIVSNDVISLLFNCCFCCFPAFLITSILLFNRSERSLVISRIRSIFR